MRIDVARLLQDLGGPAEVVEKLRSNGLTRPPGIKAVEKWRERGNIPTKWVLALTEIQRKAGRKRLVLTDYIIREGEGKEDD